jgi:hypothetical protein
VSASPLDAALAYAQRGWPVHPLRPRSKVPLTQHGVHDASCDERVICDWWRGNASANVGIATGESSGLIVLDIDPRSGGSTDGLDVPATLTARTGGGGNHYVYSAPGARRGRKYRPGVDIKADGGYIVAPPSSHPLGGAYAWVDPSVPVAPAPAWLLEATAPEAPVRVQTALATTGAGSLERYRKYVAAMPAAISGSGGHDATFAVARKLVGLEWGDAMSLLEEYNQRCQPPWSRQELEHKLTQAREKGQNVGIVDRPRPMRTPAPAGDDGAADSKPTILLAADIADTVNQAIEALAPTEVYQRGGVLVDVIRTASTEGGVVRPDGLPRIRTLPKERLRELMGEAADWVRETKGKYVCVQPPVTIAAHVQARGQWPHIRPLEGVVGYPVLTPAGDVLLAPGYDPATRLIFEPSVHVTVPDRPSREDARRAAELILERVVDFPFGAPAHRSAWLAALLTPLARPAIDGPAPLNLIDANNRGAGKTMLADLVGAIVLGRPLSRRTAPDEQAEWRKSMLAIAVAADPMVLIDNITAVLKSDALDAVLTGTEFRDRILGRNEELSLPVRTVFFATANNAMLSADLVRRSLHIRLEVMAERPELRTGFRWPDLLGSAIQDRAALLAASMTILRAYVVAGRPRVEMLPMGSYEAWSRVVRAAIVWAGLDDPARTQEGLRETADPEREGIAALLRAWRQTLGDRAVAASELLRRAEDVGEAQLRDAIQGLVDGATGGMPSAKALGYKLRRIRGRVVAGLVLQRVSEHTEVGTTWRVQGTADDADDTDNGSIRTREGVGDLYIGGETSSCLSASSAGRTDAEVIADPGWSRS